jgi:hypothetical protein
MICPGKCKILTILFNLLLGYLQYSKDDFYIQSQENRSFFFFFSRLVYPSLAQLEISFQGAIIPFSRVGIHSQIQ